MAGRSKADIEAMRNASVGADEPFWRHWRNEKAYPPRRQGGQAYDILTFCPRAKARVGTDEMFGLADVERAMWRWQYLRRRPEYQEQWRALRAVGAQSSGYFGLIHGLPDPNDADPDMVVFDHQAGIHGERTFIQVFDLGISFTAQIDRIRNSFERAQGKYRAQVDRPDVRRAYDSTLLRALDAHQDGASNADIGRIIVGKVRDGGYSDVGGECLRRARASQNALAPLNEDKPVAGYDLITWRGVQHLP